MASRNYSSTAGKMSLVGAISAGATTLIVDATTGLPGALPYVLMLDPGLSTEEIVDVTAAGGTTLTVSRGVDGTPAQSHLTGAEVRHAYSARDFRDSRDHEAATVAHGAAGGVVGATNAQTLTNKAISGATNTISSIPKGALPGDVTYTATAQTLTGKSIDGTTNTLTNVPKAALPTDVMYGTSGGPVVGTTGTFSAGLSATSGSFSGPVAVPSLTVGGQNIVPTHVESGKFTGYYNGSTQLNTTIYFSTAFQSAPAVVVTSSSGLLHCYVTTITASTAQVYLRNFPNYADGAETVYVSWIASGV